MKHSEIYDKHADRRQGKKSKKRVNESDNWDRHARVSFKNYVRDLRQADLEAEFDDYEDDADLTE